MAWLDENSRPEDVVLSSLTIGQYVPSVAGNSAFLAHWAQTLDFFEKRRLVGEFFAGRDARGGPTRDAASIRSPLRVLLPTGARARSVRSGQLAAPAPRLHEPGRVGLPGGRPVSAPPAGSRLRDCSRSWRCSSARRPAPARPPSGWSGASRSSLSSGSDGWFPDVAADDRGRVHVVWQGGFADVAAAAALSAGGESEQLSAKDVSALFYTHWDGRSWSRPRDIALIAPEGHALRSSLAVDQADRLHLVYKGLGRLIPDALGQEDLWHTVVPGDRGDELSAWQPPTRLTRATQGYYSDLAVDSRGVIHAIWTESGRGSWGIYYARSTDGGADLVSTGCRSRSRVRLVVPTPADRRPHRPHPRGLGADRSEAPRATRAGPSTRSRATADRAGRARPSTGRPRSADSRAAAGPQQPAVGVDGAGTILLIFRDPNSNRILYRRSADGATWSEPTPLPGVRVGVRDRTTSTRRRPTRPGTCTWRSSATRSTPTSMSLLHSEWDGETWSAATVVVSGTAVPRVPATGRERGQPPSPGLVRRRPGRHRPSADRHQVQHGADVGPARDPRARRGAGARAGRPRRRSPSPASGPGRRRGRDRPRSWAATTEAGRPGWTGRWPGPSFPVAAALAAVAGLLAVVVVVRVASADARGG